MLPAKLILQNGTGKGGDQSPTVRLAALVPGGLTAEVVDLLTDDDAATLVDQISEGMGLNTLRAILSDLSYLTHWARAATAAELPWPAPAGLVLKFMAHHLWDASKKAGNEKHGMPTEVQAALLKCKALREAEPHRPSTVRRRLALWSTLHHWRGLVGPFGDPQIRTTLKKMIKAAKHARQPKSPRAITRDILDRLVDSCNLELLRDVRDRALLLVGFASGGRRRSEIGSLNMADLKLFEEKTEKGKLIRRYTWTLIGTKTSKDDKRRVVHIAGRAAKALRLWLRLSGITQGPVFRPINRHNKIGDHALSGWAVNEIVKARCKAAGLDAKDYTAHGLRSGFMTEAGMKRVGLLNAMAQSQHASVQQASEYYDAGSAARSRAVRLAG